MNLVASNRRHGGTFDMLSPFTYRAGHSAMSVWPSKQIIACALNWGPRPRTAEPWQGQVYHVLLETTESQIIGMKLSLWLPSFV